MQDSPVPYRARDRGTPSPALSGFANDWRAKASFGARGTRTPAQRVSVKGDGRPAQSGTAELNGSKAGAPRDNLLLAALPAQERKRLEPFLRCVDLPQGKDLILPNEPIRHMYFPITMVTSTLQELSNGSSIETGLMGAEGLIGIQFWLMQRSTPSHTIVQVAGRSYQMSSEDFKREVMD